MSKTRHSLNTLFLILASLITAACGSDSSSPGKKGNDGGNNNANTATLTGTAAVGAAISNGILTAICADGSGFDQSIRTEADGSWSGTINSDALPCALRVSGGSPAVTLHSYASTGGTVNITPLTDLALALATNTDPLSWFNNFNGNTVDINSATTNLLDAMAGKGFNIPTVGNPFSTPFSADGTGWDGLLDDIAEAIEADPSLADYNALKTLVKDNQLASLPDAPDAPTPANYTISGTISGASGIVYWETHVTSSFYHDGGGSNGAVDFTYGDGLEEGAEWEVIVTGEPAGQDCSVTNGSGTLTANITNVQVICEDETVESEYFTISGSISGASSNVVWETLEGAFIHHDGGNGNGPVTFTSGQGLEEGSVWSVVVNTEPAGQNCSVNNGSGTLTANVDNVQIICVDESAGGDVDYSQLQGKNAIALRPNDSAHVFLLQGANEYSSISSGLRRFRFGYHFSSWPEYDADNLFNGAIVTTSILHVNYLPGTYACDGVDNTLFTVDLAGSAPWNGTFTADSCTVVVEHGSKFGGFMGYIESATLSNSGDTASFTLSNVPFRIYQHVGTAGAAPALGANGYASMYIEEPGVFEFPGGQHFILDNRISNTYGMSPDDGTPPFTGNASDRITLRNITPIASGTSACNTGALTAGRYQGELLYRANEAGASCERTGVGSAGSFTWSTYTATLIAREADTETSIAEADRTVTISGEIRNFMLNPVLAGNGGNEGSLGVSDYGFELSIDDGNTHFPVGQDFLFPLLDEENNGGASAAPYTTSEVEVMDMSGSRTNKNSTMGIYLKQVPNEVGVHTCNDVDTVPPRVQLDSGQSVVYGTTINNFSKTMAVGASCTITVDSVTPLTGSFTATLIGPDGTSTIMPDSDDTISVSGSFQFPL